MQEEENNPDERHSLYEEFVEEVVKNANPEAFFDEEDLIEIFDYASDLDNYVVKMEVLLYGARHYHGSAALETRRAWFYSSLGEAEAAREVNSRVTSSGVLNRLLDLRTEIDRLEPNTLRHRLTAIINDAHELVDEDLIQLVDFCADNSLLDFLQVLRPAIMERSSYPQTFLYQWADAAEVDRDFETAITLFEELTMREPFTLDFWLRLATAQGNANRYEAAIQSAEMALAIDPDSLQPKRVKAYALFNMERDYQTVVDLLTPVVKSDFSEGPDISIVANSLLLLGRRDEAIKSLKEYLEAYPASRLAIDTLLVIEPQVAVPYVRTYLTQYISAATEAELGSDGRMAHPYPVVEWVGMLLSTGRYEAAATVVNTHVLDVSFYIWGGLIFELNYAIGNYGKVVDLFETSIHNQLEEPFDTHDPSIVFPYLMSLVRLGRDAHALCQAKRILSNFEANRQSLADGRIHPVAGLLPATRRSILDGYRDNLRAFIDGVEANADPDSYDPMRVA
ncbi:MAG: tetratricopeptide repeat protein [Duncaniella sp.]|nr:tetratricopeptide repeat protein [Duncaniella sp.]